MTADLNVVGQSVERSDGVGFVTGRAAYTADLTFPGMLHLRMVRSPLHHARIRGVDLSGAERVKGFVRALTHEDVPHNVYTILGLIGVEPEEEFVLAVDRVRYMGEPIVAILAETEAAAIEAAAAVRLDLEELPAVFDLEEALAPGAPVVTHWGNNTFIYEGDTKRKVRLGDVEAGFAEAEWIVQSAPLMVFEVNEAEGTGTGRVTLQERSKKRKSAKPTTTSITYHDRYVRRSGTWLFAERRLEVIERG